MDIAPGEQIETGQGYSREALTARLEELRAEFKAGEKQMEELEKRRAQLRDTLLRISGAIQVLEEMLTSE
jgi:predicted nuclease with TOPRIM domain